MVESGNTQLPPTKPNPPSTKANPRSRKLLKKQEKAKMSNQKIDN
jgi:hypothetical protein